MNHLKLKVKYILTILATAIIIAGGYAYREYYRKPADLSDVQPQSKIGADSLVLSFENNETSANKLYLGKPIEIRGIIAEIKSQKYTVVNVMLGKKDDMHRVNCLIDVNHIIDVKSYNIGDKITIRGICNGYLMDVELNRCVIVK